MDKIKNKLREAFAKLSIPAPDQDSREHNIRRATEEFESHQKISEKNRQGFSILGRLTAKVNELLKHPGGENMHLTRKFIGALTVAMVTVVVGTTIYRTNQGPLPIITSPEQIESTTQTEIGKGQSEPQEETTVAQSRPESGKEVPTALVVKRQPAKGNEVRRREMASSVVVAEKKDKKLERQSVKQAESYMAEGEMDIAAGAKLGKMKAVDSMAYRQPMPMVAAEAPAQYYRDEGRDKFEKFASATVHQVASDPVSTFSSDVDTASYTFVRRQLNNGRLPQKNAVRVEEMINYFDYDYPASTNAKKPFRPTVAVYPTPWNQDTKLLHIGIRGYELDRTQKPAANLVFLVDVSGSMNSPDKLPLAKNALRMLVDTMTESDTVSLVVYAGAAGVVLEPTPVKEKGKILAALDNLSAGGSTAGGAGIRLAYSMAERNFKKEGVNRVMLFSDGDFNVGITNREELKSFIEQKRKSGIFFSVFGFGQGNYNDALMQVLAQNGNGNAAYIDTLNEARKTLVDEASSTLFTIATDLKFQIEFNPALVKEYRLIGYETRALNRADFNNDKIDAGDIGSGHRVTAIYEITPVSSEANLIDDLRYDKAEKKEAAPTSNEYGFLKIRYKLPGETKSDLLTQPIDRGKEYKTLADVPEDLRFGAAVAAFGQVLRGGEYTGSFGYKEIINLASGAKGKDSYGYRSEFINLVRLAMTARTM